MKKFFFIVSLLFSVVCFAAPPPYLLPDNIPDKVEFVVQDNVNPTIFTIDVQEVTFNYLGDYELISYQEIITEPVAILEFPELVIKGEIYMYIDELTRPPANNRLTGALKDMQNSNYGYPFTGDNC